MNFDKRLPVVIWSWGIRIFSLLFAVWLTPICSAEIRINEILAAASKTDSNGTSLDWVEIFNPGQEAVNLDNYCLTDDPQNPRKWNFPRFDLPANGYFLVLATGYGYYNPGEYHANFRLDSDGEFLGLYRRADLALVDSIVYPAQERDISYGRDPGDFERWLYFEPTPGEANVAVGVIGRAQEPQFSLTGGVYENPVTVALSTVEAAEIRYTLDGSAPLQTSELYQNPIALTKTTPLRARTFREGYSPSRITTHTFFIGEGVRLDKISLVTDPPNLWDNQKGIYTNPTQTGPDWERPASFEYFRQDGSRWTGVDAGLRIQGGASRTRAEKKSFRVYFRSAYGTGKLRVPLIPSTPVDEFDSFILRAGYNDSWIHWDEMERNVAVYISDQLGRDVHGDMGFVSSHGSFAELYLNGQYWGLYNLCERYDGDFFESYYGGADWDIISDDQVVEGEGNEWNDFVNFVTRADMRNEETYRQILNRIDIDEITAYYILNIWVQNHDWPHHNWCAARERKPGARWRLFVWDIEDSFGSGASRGEYSLNTVTVAQQGGIIGTIFHKLLQNETYKLYFKEQLNQYLAAVLNPTFLFPRLDNLAEQVRAAMPFEAARWNPGKSMKDWDAALEIARRFITNRTAVVLDDVYQDIYRPTPTPTPKPLPPTPTPVVPASTPTPTPTRSIPAGNLGIFDAHADIGAVMAAGDALYNPQTGQYTVTGSGWDIWDTADTFHFLYKEIRGDFSLEAEVDGKNLGSSDWAKFALMARDTLDAGAVHFTARVQESTFQASSQWRMETGGVSASTGSVQRVNLDRSNCRLRVTRSGNDFSTYYFDGNTNNWTLLDGETVAMDDPIYAGLAVTSHDDGQYAQGFYKNVKLTGQNVSVIHWMMYELK